MLAPIVDNFEKVLVEDPNPKKKHLPHRLVKKVLIHSRRTVEVWYWLPKSQRFADWKIWLPICNSMRSRPGWVDPEVCFRIVHTPLQSHNGSPVATYREQTVEITLKHKGAIEDGKIGTLTRRASVDQVMSAVPPLWRNPKPPKELQTPRVVKLLRKAIEWQALLESEEFTSQGEIANQEGITRARVTQIMGMLHLAPEIREKILSMPKAVHRPQITERVLRPICAITNYRDQLREFHRFLG